MYNALYESDSDDDSNKSDNKNNTFGSQSQIANGFRRVSSSDNASKGREEPPYDVSTTSVQSTPSGIDIPSYEDLSGARADEETVLEAVYGDDFQRKAGKAQGALFEVRVRPPDIEPKRIGCFLTLSIQLGKKYPYVAPTIVLKEAKGLTIDEMADLKNQLENRARELAAAGSVMMVELVQVVEFFLIEHNRDPTMSAWEEMQAREALEKSNERKAEEEIERYMNSATGISEIQSPKNSHHSLRVTFQDEQDVERELARQRQAFAAANALRLGKFEASTFKMEGISESDVTGEHAFDEDLDYDPNLANFGSGSRYEADFVELGVLGRGGGGEVVKAKNRLDRRIYAVKKVILESERGKNAKFAALQNRKLLREVTTISRMTHVNIVRYYQAWVEGSTDTTDADTIDKGVKPSIELDQGENASDDESDGWWTNSPLENKAVSQNETKNLRLTAQQRVSDSSSSGSDEDDDNSVFSDESKSDVINDKNHDQSIESYSDEDQIFHSPMITGLGFQNQMYHDLYEKNKHNAGSSEDKSAWDESSVKVTNTQGKMILYIQMEYCSTTLRELIDNQSIQKLGENVVWRLIRQTLEALSYLHRRNIIHRDLKPSNIFLDIQNSGSVSVRLGDFGLATTRRQRNDDNMDGSLTKARLSAHDTMDTMDDISDLIGEPAMPLHSLDASAGGDSMTGGVGTTFYIAPEQERNSSGDSPSYTVQADLFSFGIILFEMFHPPFATYMERAETLTLLRCDRQGSNHKSLTVESNLNELAQTRFPPSFVRSAPENAQRIILWCLERDPKKRPSATDLLSSELLPRKIELEQRYLQEAMDILTSSQSDTFHQILHALFSRKTLEVMDLTFDTDIAAKANSFVKKSGEKSMSPSEELLRAVSEIRPGSVNLSSVGSLAMNASSLIAATSALKRARDTGKLDRNGGIKGGGAMVKRAAQRTAGILAMRAATAAAITGSLDGVHGADPIVVESVCSSLKSIFEQHGAIHMKSPLLRPRPNSSLERAVGGPAELLNERGSILLLPEDLTATFARAVGRAGTAASHIKRYAIDRVFHKSMAGGHPRESLEASFDIVHEENASVHMIEAEVLLVASQAMGLLPSYKVPMLKLDVNSPLWYIRLGHTRLADSILELLGIPSVVNLRRTCLHIFSRFIAPAPHAVAGLVSRESSKHLKGNKKKIMEKVDIEIRELVENFAVKTDSSSLLRNFVSSCVPLSPNIDEALNTIQRGIAMIRYKDDAKSDSRRTRRFEDAAKSLKRLRDLIETCKTLGLSPIFGSASEDEKTSYSRPLYISLDLGLCQRRKHYHGGTIFQCVVLPDDYFESSHMEEHNDALVSPSGRGIKVAEGGNFSDLVRRNRPPGNFASSFITYYSTSPIPVCAGVRFAVGKIVELVYLDATLRGRDATVDNSWTDADGLGLVRRSLGYPLNYEKAVQCVVASIHGMDAASAPERLYVASRLWSEGIAAEYLPQSGVILSLLKRIQTTPEQGEGASDWSLIELQGVCALLKIPFIVIVQPHLLKDRNLVRLRSIRSDLLSFGPSSANSSEMQVTLDDLGLTILGSTSSRNQEVTDHENSVNFAVVSKDFRSTRAPHVECIFVDNDQYFGNDRIISRTETLHYKSFMKNLKSVKLATQNFLSAIQDVTNQVVVFAVADMSFFVIRDFGTTLMQHDNFEQTSAVVCAEMIDKYPKHKRSLRTLSVAIDNYLKQHGIWKNTSNAKTVTPDPSFQSSSSNPTTILLYSKVDERFDMITIGHGKNVERSKRK